MKPVKTLIIKGRIPSKKNSKMIVTRGKRPFLIPQAKYVEWHKQASLQIKEQKIIWCENIQEIQIEFWMPDNRQADLSNKAESIMDLLVDCEVIEDDRWQIVSRLTLSCAGIDKENPRAEIWIKMY